MNILPDTSMNGISRVPAIAAYLPVIGWLYVLFFQRQNVLGLFHLKQSLGLFLFLVGTLVGWFAIAWLLAWIPFLDVLAVSLFTMVIAAYLYGIVAWVLGLSNAFRRRVVPLPLFGRWANRLPIR